MSIAFQGSAFFPKTKIDSKRNIELKKIIDSELLLNPELVVSQLAIKLGCAESTIRKRRRELNIISNFIEIHHPLSQKKIKKIIKLFESNYKIGTIAKYVNLSVSRVKRLLEDEGYNTTNINNKTYDHFTGLKKTINVAAMMEITHELAAKKFGSSIEEFKNEIKNNNLRAIACLIYVRKTYNGEIIYTHKDEIINDDDIDDDTDDYAFI